jgi:hypothetical protein
MNLRKVTRWGSLIIDALNDMGRAALSAVNLPSFGNGPVRHEGLWGPGQDTAEELYPYRAHPAPADQKAAQHRHRVMRRARSPKQRAKLLQELEQRYLDGS